ncbi:hypothetical protein CSC94_00515 [Zhengella mangrovi]|uniref:C-type lysozyme inhibitor domain-containing protein n=2 Tax=Zhengella mangrovi TaxID=1982044 RepID=A0A2G1QTI0_9HYPH|nr:hypothetical protein CSC94_00515 [Zhengella mangrovi]
MADKEGMKPIRLLSACLCLPLLASCVAQGPAVRHVEGAGQPRVSSWQCDGGGTMTVTRVGDAVQVNSPRGVDVTLPASPPGSRERYGEGLYAVVFNGREALWFVTGKSPLNCKR